MTAPLSAPSSFRFTTPPTLEDIDALADQVMAGLPPAFLAQCHNLVVRVEEFPDEETETEMELDSPFDLLGLYRGVDLPHRSVSMPPPGPDMVFLYRRPLLDYWCETGEDLAQVVRHVLIHEIGHHFGFSDQEMERIDAGGTVTG